MSITQENVTAKVQSSMEANDLDALIAVSPWNVAYTAGTSFFTQRTIPERLALVLMVRAQEPVFIYCSIEEEHAKGESWIRQRRGYTEFADKPIAVLADVIGEMGLGRSRIGIEKRFLVAKDYDQMRDALPHAQLVEADAVFDRMKALKTPDEIEWLRKTVLWTDGAVATAFGAAKAGDTERQIGERMIAETRSHGATRLLHLALATGANLPKVHHEPDDTRLAEGSLLRTDFGMFWGLYVSDIARTAIVGPAQPHQVDTYKRLEEIHQTVIAAMKPGVRACDLYRLCADTYAAKTGQAFPMPHVGHSIGHSVHENPMLHPFDSTELEAGMVMMLEPMLLGKDGIYHTEDMIEITGNGHRILSRSRDWSEPLVIG